jgi:hypothetical protein
MGKMGLGKPKTHETWYLIHIINKHENISAGVYWDDTGVPGLKVVRVIEHMGNDQF